VSSVNKAMLLGNLGRDPELRYTQSGTAVCSLSVATSRKWRDKRTDELVEETEWHRVSVFGQQAEHCANYLSKGRQVWVEGRLRTRKYDDRDGITRYSTEVVADVVQFLDPSRSQRDHEEFNHRADQHGQGGMFTGEPEPADPHDPARHRKPDGRRRS
jgi:single-strand DNA-binding protein